MVCKWSDIELTYIREDFQLEKDAVFEEIKDAFLKQSDLDVHGFSKQIYHSTIADICDRTFCYGCMGIQLL